MRAIVLFGHGSRDPLWRKPMEEVARRLLGQNSQLQVRCAYLELDQPDLATAVTQLVSEGAGAITVVPMFLGVGRHAREDLPALVEQLRRRHPAVTLRLQPAVGEDSRLLDVLAQIALG